MTCYFPIKILLTETGEILVCMNPDEVPSGKPFRVLEVNYEMVLG